KVPWLREANYGGAGTAPDFNLRLDRPEVRLGFQLEPGRTIEIGTLLDALSGAGFPPVSMRVARMGAGVPFGFPLPGDLELLDAGGRKLRSGQLQKPGRPLVLLFFPLKGKYKQGQEERTYQAEPRHFARLNQVAGQYAGRADFVAISSR